MNFKHPDYHEDAIQSYVGAWWECRPHSDYQRGELIWCFVPHVHQTPWSLIPVGRNNPTSHHSATFMLEQTSIKRPVKPTPLPVAAMPVYPGETYSVHRAKKRPALIVSTGGDEVDRKLNLGKGKWTTTPTILVAPYYGDQQTGSRGGGLAPPLRKLVLKCTYPQYILDKLPFPSSSEDSFLRLDHIQPIGRHHDSIERTGCFLTQDAMEVLDQWLTWLMFGTVPRDCFLDMYRREVCGFADEELTNR